MKIEDILDKGNLENTHPFSWDETRQSELISAVKDNYPIWDVSSEEHKSVGNKLSNWQAVANTVSGKPSVEACKKKWKSLRVQYTRIIKAKSKRKSGQSVENNVKVTWRYFEAMNFLQASTVVTTVESEPDMSFHYALRSSSPSNAIGCLSETPSMTSDTSTSIVGISKISKRKRKDRNTVDPDCEDVKKAAEILQKALQTQSLNDEHQRFSDMLADELRRAYTRNPDAAHHLRRNLMMTVTSFWQNELPQYRELINK